MLEKHALSELSIVSCLRTHYGIEAASLTLLPLGADVHSCVYRAHTLDQRSYFIKLKHGHDHDISVEIAELLQSAGIHQIVSPVQTVDGRSTQCIENSTLIVYPFVEGQDGFNRALTKRQWIEFGRALRQIHALEVPLFTQNRIRQEAFSAKWRDAVRSIYAHVEDKPVVDEVALKLQTFMKKHMADIQRLVDRAQQLAEILHSHSPKFVLCHSDIHAGNVLMDGNAEVYLVDWDEPIMAPKERDLMFIGGGVGNVWNKTFEEELFYQGYGETDVNPTLLAYYRHERIVEDIAIYSRELLLSSAGGADRLEMYGHFIAMFEPQGVVEVAFKTDKDLPV